MKKRLFILPLALSLFLLPSCQGEVTASSEASLSIPTVEDSAMSINESELDIDSAANSAIGGQQNLFSNMISINLEDGASTTSDSQRVTIDNASNVISINQVGDYVISGNLSDGVILSKADALEDNDTVRIILNGVFLGCSGAYSLTLGENTIVPGPIYSTGTANLLFTLPEDTASVVVDNRDGHIVGEQNDASIYSNSKIRIRGKGSLRVNAFCNNGIESKKGIDAYGITLSVLSPGSCLKAKNSIVLGRAEEGGSFAFFSTGEAGHGVEVYELDTSVKIPVFGNTEENDDIAGIELKDAQYFMSVPGSALSSAGYLYMEGGNGMIESKESHALYAEKDLFIDGGSFYLKADNGDGIRSNSSSVLISEGTYSIDAGTKSWCQGIRAEVLIDVRGGHITVSTSYRGFTAQKISASGGITSVTSVDDGWKATDINKNRNDTLVDVRGGNHYINSEGDGVDSDGRFEMRAGLLIIAYATNGSHSPVEAGMNLPLEINGGTLVAYGGAGQVQSLSGRQNTVVVKRHSSLHSQNYYILRAGYSYYALKISKESSAICASFGEYSNNEYAILTANSINPETTIWENAGFFKVSWFGYQSTICNGAFHGRNNQHPEHAQNMWNGLYGWGYNYYQNLGF